MKAHFNHFLQTFVFLSILSLLGIKAAYSQSITPAGDTPTTISSPANQPNQLNISGGSRSGANLFHSFQQFGLSQGQIANFLSTPSIQNILGRVVGGNTSTINGLLQVTGGPSNLFLMNPAGIIFGSNARLNVPASFVATTANGIQIGDRWFNATGSNNYASLSGTPNSVAFLGNNPGAILNAGTLQVSSGQAITLLGGTVINTGTIEAPGGTITIASVPGENLVRISQSGSLLSLKLPLQNTEGLNPPTITPLSLPALLTGGGMPEATGVTVENGVVRLIGSNTPIATAPGTTINTGNLSASSAIAQGNGGQIILWGDRTLVQGQITANAGVVGGNGGLVETSGPQQLDVTGAQVEARATQGLPGNWIIDPSDITIANTGGTVTPAQLETTLDRGTNVSLTTASGTGGNGDTTLADSINQIGGGIASLTLTGRRFTNPGNTTISMTSLGGLTFNLNQVNPEPNPPTSSIQSAVNAIGSVAGDRTINLGAGTYSGNTLTIDLSLNLTGAGASDTILSGNNAYRVMTITPGNTVTIDGVTIANGKAVSTNEGGISDDFGGGIFNNGATLTLTKSSLNDNSARLGAGIYNSPGSTLILSSSALSRNWAQGIQDRPYSSYGQANAYGGGVYNNGGTLVLTNSTLSDNRASGGSGISPGTGNGGGIYNNSGSLTVINSTLTNNRSSGGTGPRPYAFASSSGGGIYNSGGTLTVINSTLNSNVAGFGGAIYNTGLLTFINSTLKDNSVWGSSEGGGIFNSGYALVSSSTLIGNLASSLNSSPLNFYISFLGRGGGIFNTGLLTLADSTLSGNLAGQGGAIFNRGIFTMTNSTLSGNSASGAIVYSSYYSASGGAIYNDGGVFVLTNSTITDNWAKSLINGLSTEGGGIYNRGQSPSGSLTIKNSLITGNNAVTGSEVANRGIAISEGYNLFGNNGISGVEGIVLTVTDIVPTVSLDRILAPLTNNGGPTQTHALVPSSPAINAGDPNLTTPDQRGFRRVGRADIGAFEFQSLNPFPEPSPETPKGSFPGINLPAFSLADISEITAALYGRPNELLTLTLQPQPTKPILCVVRSQDGNRQQIDEYGGLPDCP